MIIKSSFSKDIKHKKKDSKAPLLKSAIQEKTFIVYWIKQYMEKKQMLLFQRLEKLTTHVLCFIKQKFIG